jgi:hypothetical protein
LIPLLGAAALVVSFAADVVGEVVIAGLMFVVAAGVVLVNVVGAKNNIDIIKDIKNTKKIRLKCIFFL